MGTSAAKDPPLSTFQTILNAAKSSYETAAPIAKDAYAFYKSVKATAAPVVEELEGAEASMALVAV